MLAADPRSQMLAEMSQCAYRLGLAFGAEAERAETTERRLEYFHLFDRCFFAVRVATALELRLRRAPAERAEAAETERAEPIEAEPIEQDRTERDAADHETEGDRERDREVASLPVFLRTLGGIAADASALPGPPPAALPTLRELLARVTSEPAPIAKPRTAGGALRSRLAGSATTQALTLPPPVRSGRLRSEHRAGSLVRGATGPPRR